MDLVLAVVAKLFGSKIIWDGITVAQIISWFRSDQGKQAIEVLGGVTKSLVKNGDSIATAGLKALAMVARVHKMTPAEEKIWMERNTYSNKDLSDFPQ